MAVLTILKYPDPRLHKVAQAVSQVDQRIRTLVADMLETMYANDGVGLAATQVDVHERVLVMDVSDTRDQPLVLINPEIVGHSDQRVLREEGCLSVPSIYDKVSRFETVTVRALDREGQVVDLPCEGLLAVCVQHEMDHLAGHVFVDHLSPLKRDRIKSKLAKRARDQRA